MAGELRGSATESNAIGFVLQPGNALLLNNYRTCHTRTGFNPSFGVQARWFLRGNYKTNLWSGDLASRQAVLRPGDMDQMTAYGWADENGNLSAPFLPFVESPQKVATLPAGMRDLAARALHLTPVRGSRIV